jgi:predicted DNA binding CopG/RHH family protein
MLGKKNGMQSAFMNVQSSFNEEELEKKVTQARKNQKQRAVNLMIDDEDYKNMKIRIAHLDITMKDYIVGLIKKDLENKGGH